MEVFIQKKIHEGYCNSKLKIENSKFLCWCMEGYNAFIKGALE